MGGRGRRSAGRGRAHLQDESDRPRLPRASGGARPRYWGARSHRSLHVHAVGVALVEPAVGRPGRVRFGASDLGVGGRGGDLWRRDRSRLLPSVSELSARRERCTYCGDPDDPRIPGRRELARRKAPGAGGSPVHPDLVAPLTTRRLDLAGAGRGGRVDQHPRKLRHRADPGDLRARRRRREPAIASPVGAGRRRDDRGDRCRPVRAHGVVLPRGRLDQRHDQEHRRRVAASLTALGCRVALLALWDRGRRRRADEAHDGQGDGRRSVAGVLRARRGGAPIHRVVGTCGAPRRCRLAHGSDATGGATRALRTGPEDGDSGHVARAARPRPSSGDRAATP